MAPEPTTPVDANVALTAAVVPGGWTAITHHELALLVATDHASELADDLATSIIANPASPPHSGGGTTARGGGEEVLAVLDRLLSSGVAGAPAFALIHAGAGSAHLFVRGNARVQIDDETVVHGLHHTTWVETTRRWSERILITAADEAVASKAVEIVSTSTGARSAPQPASSIRLTLTSAPQNPTPLTPQAAALPAPPPIESPHSAAPSPDAPPWVDPTGPTSPEADARPGTADRDRPAPPPGPGPTTDEAALDFGHLFENTTYRSELPGPSPGPTSTAAESPPVPQPQEQLDDYTQNAHHDPLTLLPQELTSTTITPTPGSTPENLGAPNHPGSQVSAPRNDSTDTDDGLIAFVPGMSPPPPASDNPSAAPTPALPSSLASPEAPPHPGPVVDPPPPEPPGPDSASSPPSSTGPQSRAPEPQPAPEIPAQVPVSPDAGFTAPVPNPDLHPTDLDDATIALSRVRGAFHADRPVSPTVQAVLCPAGHANPPHGDLCRVCDEPIIDRSVHTTARPSLGRLLLGDGTTVELDRHLVIGRNPASDDLLGSEPAELIRLDDPDQVLSRTHTVIRLDGWQVQVIDRDSMNHTYVQVPGRPPFQLRPGEAYPLPPGSTITLGDEVSMTYEVGSP